MGDLYRYGLGIKADNHIAHDYYHRAATLGSASAAQKLISDAALYHPQQYEQIKTAALQQQQTETIYRLAEAQAHAIGRPADYNAARKNYMEAAEFHHKNAAAALGRIYHYGSVRRKTLGQPPTGTPSLPNKTTLLPNTTSPVFTITDKVSAVMFRPPATGCRPPSATATLRPNH